MQKVDFRYSDTDFVAYLLTLGYDYTYFETVRDKHNKLKCYVHFSEDKDELISHFDKYMNGEVVANVLEMKKNRKIISKLIKSELLRHQAEEIKCK